MENPNWFGFLEVPKGVCQVGWSYRRSLKAGPFRVNVSKTGIGYSVGGRGFRTGIRAGGRRYTAVSIPGTGLRYSKTAAKGATGCLLVLVGSGGLAMVLGALL
jgi:hypothetical protein